MLTEREERLKEKLVAELGRHQLSGAQPGGLSYAEKKHLREELDPAFVRDELDKMRPRLRWLKWSWPVAFALWALLMRPVWDDGWLVPVVTACLFGLTSFLMYQTAKQRVWIYELLAELAEEPPSALPGASPEIERTETVQHATFETIQRR